MVRIPSYLTLIEQWQQGRKKPIVFQNGQIFYGKVMQIYPFGYAYVKFGQEQLMAKVVAPLDARNGYWFQVLKEDGKIQLKVLNSFTDDTRLLHLYQLPKTETMLSFLRHWKEWGLPFDRELMLKGEQWLKESPDIHLGLTIIRTMITNQLPLTEEVFHGLRSIFSGESFHLLFARFHDQVKKEQVSISPRLETILQSFFIKPEHLFEHLLVEWLHPSRSKSDQQLIFELLTYFFPKLAEKTESEWLEEMAAQFDKNFSGRIDELKALLFQQLTSLANKRIQKEKLFSILYSEKQLADISISELLQKYQQLMASGDKNIQQIFHDFIEKHPLFFVNWQNGKEIKLALQTIIRLIGLENGPPLASYSTLKQELQVLLQQSISPTMRKLAEQLLARIIGEQLLFSEQDTILQLTFAIPVPFHERMNDIVIQWFGKKKGKKLDENFCKIFFALTMSHLGEVIIQMIVQKRIISLSIYSEYEKIEELAQPFLPLLSEKIKDINYQLGTVKFMKVPEKTNSLSFSGSFFQESRVDIKI